MKDAWFNAPSPQKPPGESMSNEELAKQIAREIRRVFWAVIAIAGSAGLSTLTVILALVILLAVLS